MNKIKTPWYKHYDGVREHLDYPEGALVELIEESANKHPDYISYNYFGAKHTYKDLIGQINCCSEAFLQMAGVFSQLELAMIRARVKSGMENAKAKGKKIGRRPTTKEDIPTNFLKHYAIFMEGKMNVSELARVCGLSRPTVYKYMKMME